MVIAILSSRLLDAIRTVLFNKNELENTEEKVPNFTMKFKNLISSKEYSNSSPEEILSYIYAILYSPTYRDRYYEYLKIDYPKIPFTDNLDTFLKLSKIGKELIDLHLMKNIPSYEDLFLDFTSNGNSKNCSFIIKNMQSKERYKNQRTNYCRYRIGGRGSRPAGGRSLQRVEGGGDQLS